MDGSQMQPGKTLTCLITEQHSMAPLKLTPAKMNGSGIINMTRFKNQLLIYSALHPTQLKPILPIIISNLLTTNGYSFIAENANTDINFDQKISKFRLNTDSSMVKFPELQYICTMTDFTYNMDTRVLNMEQKGKSNTPLLTPDKLIRLDLQPA